ncbi:unnamed protein product [Notodromas monacha]|uniref:DDB1- and CUL4-associated factor 15 WD40 repeat-containing domain-containing protein n=1 Tax=Notodromas monacha TaxID=399045 RepID=A0A7R9GAM6_9CRUS|nr:unnamed protein product [Notodromas monacha]CAG0915594.1 unnamed protein product [Notodromas monacha]
MSLIELAANSLNQAFLEVTNKISDAGKFNYATFVAQARQEPVILGLVLLVAAVVVTGLASLASGASFLSASIANAFSGKRRSDDSGFPVGWPNEIEDFDFDEDTAGQERFHTITTSYYRGAMGIILVYDITSPKSFDNIAKWLRLIDDHASEDVEKMILGNKCDMEDKRMVSRERGEAVAREHGIRFLETSAKDNVNIEQAFLEIANAILTKTIASEQSGAGAGGQGVDRVNVGSGSKMSGADLSSKTQNRCCECICSKAGHIYGNSRTSNNGSSVPFPGEIPSRLCFKLGKLFPASAIEAGVIFLGFSRCGRFLISYTQSSELSAVPSAQGLNYVYHLQWWLLKPPAKARKVSEIQLFGESAICHPLYVSVNEWPGMSNFVVVFGYDKMEESMMQSATCYITVTAVPATIGCRDCAALRNNLGEDYWLCDSGDILPHACCLRHGMTLHTLCCVVPPFPKSNPLRLLHPLESESGNRGKFVLSTGNFIHVFKIEFIEPAVVLKSRRLGSISYPLFSPPSMIMCHSSCNSQDYEASYFSISEAASECTSLAESNASQEDRILMINSSSAIKSRLSGQDVFEFADGFKNIPHAVNSQQRTAKFFARGLGNRGLGSGTEDAYAFVDESPPANENLSSFRRKRLAEKTYEFSDELFPDENTEASLSIPPWSRRLRDPHRFSNARIHDNSTSGSSGAVLQIRSPGHGIESLTVSISPNSPCDHPLAVLRQLNHCPNSNLLLSPRELRDHRDATDALFGRGGLSPSSNSSLELRVPAFSRSIAKEKRRKASSFVGADGRKRIKEAEKSENPWVVNFDRYYMDADDELASVMSTDLEDDELCSSTGYHNALPLEVHGAAYVQMQPVSRVKVGRVLTPIISVKQVSMDMEEFCHRMAEKVCMAAGEKLWSCEDFDVAVLAESGDMLLCCAEMLVKTKNKMTRSALGSQVFQTGLTFDWNPWTGAWNIVHMKPLTPRERSNASNMMAENWLPAQNRVREVNRRLSAFPANLHALPRRLDNLPLELTENSCVVPERSLDCIREPELGLEVRLRALPYRLEEGNLSESDSDFLEFSDSEGR